MANVPGNLRFFYQDNVHLLPNDKKENIIIIDKNTALPYKFRHDIHWRLKMDDRNIGQEILEGTKEIKRFKRGEIDLSVRTLNEPSPPKTIRKRLKLSQSAFAGLVGVSPRTIQEWEQGRRKPQGPAKSLLRIAEQHPEIFIEIR